MCLTIVSPSMVRSHLSEGMQIAIVCYTKKVGQLAAFRAVVSFVEQSMLGRSPTEAFQVDVMDDAHRVSGAAPA
jgi:hypothetical protein